MCGPRSTVYHTRLSCLVLLFACGCSLFPVIELSVSIGKNQLDCTGNEPRGAGANCPNYKWKARWGYLQLEANQN